jgi:N-lysine methyltransferase SETD6
MMFEKLNKSGQWAPCFYVAPHEFDTLIWWNDEELSELQASAVVDKIGRVEADAMFKEKLLPIVVANKRLFRYEIRRDGTEEEWERALLHEAHLMASTIMAYGFDLEPEYRDVDEDGYATEEDDADLPKAIVPMADMLNADADKNNVQSPSIFGMRKY